MKLFVKNNTGQKTYLNIVVSSRHELARAIGNQNFVINGKTYHVNQVLAEPSVNGTAAGAVVGGVLGLFGGPLGVAIGGIVGGAVGQMNDSGEQKQINFFNNTWYA